MRRRLRRVLHHSTLFSRFRTRTKPTPCDQEGSEKTTQSPQESGKNVDPTGSIWKTQLQPGQIRLFKIELDDDDDDISGSLEVFDHKTAPKYIAQSYVCGDGECNVKITVNGSALYVKPNLSIALCQTKKALQDRITGEQRYPSMCAETLTTWFWIDAICIHQSNVTELEMQIRFMEHIYRGASITFASLGGWSESQELICLCFEWIVIDSAITLRESDPSDSNRDWIRKVALPRQLLIEERLKTEFNVSREDPKAIWRESTKEMAGQATSSDPSSQASSCYHPFWQACMELLEGDWFSRVWTFQELALSRQLYVTLPKTVPWSALEVLFQYIIHLDYDEAGAYYTAMGKIRFHNFVTKRDGSWYYTAGGSETQLPLTQLLFVITSQRHATVPKDHVFAILGLMDASIRDLVEVDYSKTDAQVFREFLELALKTSNAAQMLPRLWEEFAYVPMITPGLPSWCLDLNNETSAQLGAWVGKPRFSEVIECNFGDAAHLRVSPEDVSIFLRVLELDVVSSPGRVPCPTWTDSRHLWKETPGALLDTDMLGWIKCLYDTVYTAGDCFVVVELRLRVFLQSVVRLNDDDMVVLAFLMAASLLPAKGLRLSKVVSYVRQEFHASHVHEVLMRQSHEMLAESLRALARRLKEHFKGTYVFTTGGRWLGCSPRSVSPGDRICVVPGGKYLHIFSPAPSHYVTCASIPGLVGNDLPDLVRHFGLEWEEIAIH